MVQLVHKESWDLRVLRDSKVCKALQDQQDLLVKLDLLVRKVFRVYKVNLDQLVLPVHKERLVLLVQPDLQVLKDLQEIRALLVLKDFKDLPVLKVSRVLQALLELQVRKEK